MVHLHKIVWVGGHRRSGHSKCLDEPGQYPGRLQWRLHVAPQVEEQARVGEVLANLVGQVDCQRGLTCSGLAGDRYDDGAFGQGVRVGQRGEDPGPDAVAAGEVLDIRRKLVDPEARWRRSRRAFQRAWRRPVQAGRSPQEVLLQAA